MHSNRQKFAVIVLVFVVLAGFLAVTFNGFYGAEGGDEQYYSMYGHILATQGFKPLMNHGLDGLKYLTYGGIALFFKLLGASNFTYILYDAILYSVTIIIIFTAGSKLKDYRTGLMAATLYAFFPLGIEMVSKGSDDIVMAFFAALSMLMLVYALGSVQKRKRYLFVFISGLIATIGILSVSEEILDLLPILIALTYMIVVRWNRDDRNLHLGSFLTVFFGVGTAIVLIMIFSYLAFGNPFYIPTNTIYQYNPQPYPGLAAIQSMPPFYAITQYFYYMFPLGMHQLISNRGIAETGFYFYFAVIAGIFALIWKDKKAAIPALWLASIFLYLCFGTMSLNRYMLLDSGIPQTRYLLIIAPALALLIAIGLADIFEHGAGKGRPKIERKLRDARKMHRSRYYAGIAILVIFLALVVTNDIIQIGYIKLSMYYFDYPFYNLGKFLDTLPQGSTVLTINVLGYAAPWPILIFTDYENKFTSVPINTINCTVISGYNYFVTVSDSRLAKECGLTAVYVQPPYPHYLLNYTLFGFNYVLPNVTIDTTYTVYKTSG